MTHQGLRYPKSLTKLRPDEEYSSAKIASICEVADRTVYRWYSLGYLERSSTGLFVINPVVVPANVQRAEAVKRKYTNEELEEFYLDIMQNKRDAVVDISKIIREHGLDAGILHQMLQGLDEYREFVVYLMKR